jgi:chloramphenicol-sensitive protein RarD
LEPAGAIEILAQRMLWSLVFVAIAVGVGKNWASVRSAVADRGTLGRLALAALLISLNWGVYIWGVNAHHVVETSLGYFINPLLTILLGVFVLKESLRPAQWAAVGVGAVAVLVLTIDYGRLPWIALVLACAFAGYGFLKSQTKVGAVESLAVETGVMVIPALIILFVLAGRSELTFGHHGAGQSLLLAGGGAVTAIPLLLFAAGARRLPLTVIGLLQYLAPVLQFAVGVGIRHEPMPTARVAGFGLVWIALIILCVDGLTTPRPSATGQPLRRRVLAPTNPQPSTSTVPATSTPTTPNDEAAIETN